MKELNIFLLKTVVRKHGGNFRLKYPVHVQLAQKAVRENQSMCWACLPCTTATSFWRARRIYPKKVSFEELLSWCLMCRIVIEGGILFELYLDLMGTPSTMKKQYVPSLKSRIGLTVRLGEDENFEIIKKKGTRLIGSFWMLVEWLQSAGSRSYTSLLWLSFAALKSGGPHVFNFQYADAVYIVLLNVERAACGSPRWWIVRTMQNSCVNVLPSQFWCQRSRASNRTSPSNQALNAADKFSSICMWWNLIDLVDFGRLGKLTGRHAHLPPNFSHTSLYITEWRTPNCSKNTPVRCVYKCRRGECVRGVRAHLLPSCGNRQPGLWVHQIYLIPSFLVALSTLTWTQKMTPQTSCWCGMR